MFRGGGGRLERKRKCVCVCVCVEHRPCVCYSRPPYAPLTCSLPRFDSVSVFVFFMSEILFSVFIWFKKKRTLNWEDKTGTSKLIKR